MKSTADDAMAVERGQIGGVRRKPYLRPMLDKRGKLARIAAMSDTVTSAPVALR
jgi:hypothetical protein